MTPVLQEPPSHPTGSASFRLWLYLGLIAIAALTDAVNSTILVVAREHLMGSTHSTPDEIAWVNMAYLSAKLTAFPVSAWLTTRFSAKTLLSVAISGLLVASVACAGTHDLGTLIFWRITQGVSGALLLVVGQTVLFETVSSAAQGSVQVSFCT